MKLLEQPIPANFLKLEEKVRVLSVQCKKEETPPVLKETLFRDSTKDVIANPRELNQAVTFLHENGEISYLKSTCRVFIQDFCLGERGWGPIKKGGRTPEFNINHTY